MKISTPFIALLGSSLLFSLMTNNAFSQQPPKATRTETGESGDGEGELEEDCETNLVISSDKKNASCTDDSGNEISIPILTPEECEITLFQ